MPTALFTHPSYLAHLTPQGHPESRDRLLAIANRLDSPEFAGLQRLDAPAIAIDLASAVHSDELLDVLQASVPTSGLTYVDNETILAPQSLTASLHAAGAQCRAVELVLAGEVDNAFCAVRPPGHHSERDLVQGFCLINSLAVGAARALAAGAQRVAIADFDVHHGNGTQQIFASDPRVMVASSHQMPLYPGSGSASETGVGNLVNAPLAPGSGGEAFRQAWSQIILPRLQAFCPDIVLVSAGFDAHRLDPLANLMLEESDYVWVTRQLLDLADACCRGRLVAALEGGYHLDALASSVAEHVYCLMHGSGLPGK